jgi:hypothetical protein
MPQDQNGWIYKWCKGLICSYVARGSNKPETIGKSLATTMANGEIDRNALEEILKAIDEETVQPFLGRLEPRWNQPERLERFRAVRSAIHMTLGDA